MANLWFFNSISKSGCFPKKILTCPEIDYSLGHLVENGCSLNSKRNFAVNYVIQFF